MARRRERRRGRTCAPSPFSSCILHSCSRVPPADAGVARGCPTAGPESRLRAEVRRHPRQSSSSASGGRPESVRIYSRNGNDKTRQFPEIARALAEYGRRLKAGVVLDGEVVALDRDGEPAGFQRLQGRIHLSSDAGRRSAPRARRRWRSSRSTSSGRRRGPASAAPDVAPRPPRARLRQHRLPAASPQRVRPRRRPRAPRARNRRGLGGPGRQAPASPTTSPGSARPTGGS